METLAYLDRSETRGTKPISSKSGRKSRPAKPSARPAEETPAVTYAWMP